MGNMVFNLERIHMGILEALLAQYVQIKLLIKNKLIICALGNLHSAGLEIRRSEVQIPVMVHIFLLRSYNPNMLSWVSLIHTISQLIISKTIRYAFKIKF